MIKEHEVEMNYHLGYKVYERSDEKNYNNNGLKSKKLRSSYGGIDINSTTGKKCLKKVLEKDNQGIISFSNS